MISAAGAAAPALHGSRSGENLRRGPPTAEPGRLTSGRPRDGRSDAAIRAAARELLAECGVGGLTVEAVAERAGVAKTTIYRRWRSKNELALAVLIDLAEMMPVAELGDTRAELAALVQATVTTLEGTLLGRVVQGVVSELAANHELATEFEERVVRVRREEVRRVIERGVARGDLRPDADFELAPELLVGPVYYRLLLTHRPLDATFAERVVDAVLSGFGARSKPADPGPAVTAAAPPSA